MFEDSKVAIEPSHDAERLSTNFSTENIIQESTTPLREFCNFYFLKKKISDTSNVPKEQKDCRLNTRALTLTHLYLFRTWNGDPFSSSTSDWEERHFQMVNDAIVEFAADKKAFDRGQDLAPLTLKSYIYGLKRAFEMEWGYKNQSFFDPIFKSSSGVLLTVRDIKIRELQCNRCARKSRRNPIKTLQATYEQNKKERI